MALDLSPYAIVTVARLKEHLGRATVGESDVTDRCTAAINAATAWLERRTARALKARNYRTAFAMSISTTNADATMEPATYALIYRGDDIRTVETETQCIQPGTQVASLNGTLEGTFEATKTATASITQAGCIVGTVPLVCDGTGSQVLDTPEWPVQDVWAIYEVDRSGNRSALDISQMRLHKKAGTIELGSSVFPEGERNIEIECRAGFEAPAYNVTGDWTDWTALEALALRVAEVFYNDGTLLRGRATDLSMGGLSARVSDFAMPADIEAAVWPFVRTR